MRTDNGKILLSSGTNEVEFMEFYLAGVSYGINVSKVIRVVSMSETPLNTVPEVDPSILGVIYDQGKPLKLIDLKRALKLESKNTDTTRPLIVIARFNRETVGFLIDGIHKIHRTSWDQFQPMTSAVQGGGYTTGTIQYEDRIILILDVERLMLDFSSHRLEDEKPVVTPPQLKEQRSQVNIVYAEDSKMIRKITSDIMMASGYTKLKIFENGQDALEYITKIVEQANKENKSLKEFIDLIVTDIEMPKLDGLTLCKKVKTETQNQHIPAVVVYSSLINEEMSRKCKSVGADAQLSKPHGSEIVDIIDKLCLNNK
jgi:two-component system, chemotaxis family, chemotaxis protein CheV